MILAGVVLAVCYRALANGDVFAGPDWLDGDFEVDAYYSKNVSACPGYGEWFHSKLNAGRISL